MVYSPFGLLPLVDGTTPLSRTAADLTVVRALVDAAIEPAVSLIAVHDVAPAFAA
jgi:hypothetical protein